MTEVILKINEPWELEKLIPILQQLQIKYQTRQIKPKKNDSKKEAVFAKIQSGALNIPNFDEFIKEFDENRHYSTIEGRD
jgi:hypothetical protein